MKLHFSKIKNKKSYYLLSVSMCSMCTWIVARIVERYYLVVILHGNEGSDPYLLTHIMFQRWETHNTKFKLKNFSLDRGACEQYSKNKTYHP